MLSSVKLFKIDQNLGKTSQSSSTANQSSKNTSFKDNELPHSTKLRSQPMKDKVSFTSDCAQDFYCTPGEI